MHDIVIRGGRIIDGTGAPAFTGDIAIAGGRIAGVGGKQGPARREIDADGLLVTPGWVDVHTHYDGQAMWDPLLAPSCWHGVTTVMFGNCGVGFAPVKKHHRGALMDLMEGVEEIPNPVLAAGLTWEWESFPEFMDALERRERAIDIAAQAAHLPLRVYVMGDRAIRREPATADDIAEMRRLTVEALNVGAFGFTTSRTDSHKTPDGDFVPSRDADDLELLGIGCGAGHHRHRCVRHEQRFRRRGVRTALDAQARQGDRPPGLVPADRPLRGPAALAPPDGGGARARAEGLSLTAQIAGRPIGVMMGIGTALNPFTVRPSYKALEHLPIEEQRRRLRDPQMRRQILAEKPSEAEVAKLAQFRQLITSRFDKFFTMGDPPDYEPGPEKSVAAIAQRSGKTPDEVAYDNIIEENQYLYFPVVNYTVGDHEPIREMLNDPACLLGLSDGGAHCTSIVDAGTPSYMLTHWGRDRAPRAAPATRAAGQAADQRDGRFLRADRSRPAGAGVARRREPDRFRRAQLHKPELVHDMPANGRRFVQRVEGYEATLVAGAPIFERGEHTGALPGKLVRAGRTRGLGGGLNRDRTYSRRDVLHASTALAAVFAEPVKAAAPASTAVNTALIEAARKEGKIALYSALDLALSEKIAKAFEATYQIPVRVERSGAERIFQRIGQEQTSRIRAVDLALSTDAAHFVAWKRNDWLAPYVPEDVARHFPADAIDADGTYVNLCASLCGIGYNTNLIKAEDAPRSFPTCSIPNGGASSSRLIPPTAARSSLRHSQWYANSGGPISKSWPSRRSCRSSRRATRRRSSRSANAPCRPTVPTPSCCSSRSRVSRSPSSMPPKAHP